MSTSFVGLEVNIEFTFSEIWNYRKKREKERGRGKEREEETGETRERKR